MLPTPGPPFDEHYKLEEHRGRGTQPAANSSADSAGPLVAAHAENNRLGDIDNFKSIIQQLKTIVEIQREGASNAKKSGKINSANQAFTSLAVVSIFLASLAAGFLSFVHDTIDKRPTGTKAKISDTVTIVFCYVVIVISVLNTIMLCILGQQSFIMAHSWVLPKVAGSFTRFPRSPHRPFGDHSEDDSYQAGQGPWFDDSKFPFNICTRFLRGTRIGLAMHFLMAFDIFLGPLVMSVEFFLISLLTFVWAEETRAVALVTTFSIFIGANWVLITGEMVWWKILGEVERVRS